MNRNRPGRSPNDYVVDGRELVWLLLYVGMISVSAVFFQLRSGREPNHPLAAIDFFTGGLLWLLSLTALQIAFARLDRDWRLWFWLACAAGLALVSIDEVVELHEKTRFVVGDDDHIKVLAWLCSGAALYALSRIESLPRVSRWALVFGYLIHTCHTIVDAGDGDYFTLPIPLGALIWAEELFELGSLSAYLIGFFFLRDSIVKEGLGRGDEAEVRADLSADSRGG